jgi:hypothetical protein
MPSIKAKPIIYLTSLSLSSVSFYHEGTEIARVLNITRLYTLKLWNYPRSLILLDLVVEFAEEISLIVFEFSFDIGYTNIIEDIANPTDPVNKFIRYLRGLIDLFLILLESVNWNKISSAILIHSSSL